MDLMKKSNIILVTSVKEGWGLIVTEAASQGTPAIVYDVDGLRDSVINGKTGIITKQNTPEGLAHEIINLNGNTDLYTKIQKNCLQKSREYTEINSYNDFKKILFK
jgi:glycosyltransferase involved in cell wall biosynthesis